MTSKYAPSNLILSITMLFMRSTWSNQMIFENKKIIDAVTSAASFNSSPFSITQKGFAIQAKWVESVATLGGSLKVQGSIDGVNYDDISGASATISGSGSALFNFRDQNYPYIKVVVTISGGTGVFNAFMSSKLEGF